MWTNGVRATLMAALLGLASATSASALTQAEEAAYAVLATGANIFYGPAKFFVAVAAIPVGGLAGAFSGGDPRTAYAIWVPAMGGTYFLTNGHMDGSTPIEFFGYDYDDQLAPPRRGDDRTFIYDVPYPDLYR
jgi:hypothetical protein